MNDITHSALSAPPRLLFIPVSAPRGMGEYARSLAIAKAAVQRWPGLQVHFALSRAAPYASEAPFPARLLPSSPTFHTREVSALIEELRPTIIVFDNAGRTAQIRAAARCGARIIYISSRRRQRRKAFRLRWMGLIDEHWIAYPQFIAGALTAVERLKLALCRRPRVRFIEALLPAPDAGVAAAVLANFAVRSGEYVLVVPGGGSGHPGAEDAPRIFAAAARCIAQHGYPTVLVGADGEVQADEAQGLRVAARVPFEQLCELMRQARAVISNGGDTLLQVLACRRPCIAVPIARDQLHRVNRCVAAGLVTAGRLEAAALEREALTMLAGTTRCATLERNLGGRQITNDMDIVLAALGALAGPSWTTARPAPAARAPRPAPVAPAAAPRGLSACIITFNEAERIEACIRSLNFCDEILVVDAHSTDRTRELAAALGARVIERDWPGYRSQKQFAIEAARHDWVLCLDADERVSAPLCEEILALRAQGFNGAAGWSIPRITDYFGRFLRHGNAYPDRVVRLFDRRRGGWSGYEVHENTQVDGRIRRLHGRLMHYSYRSITDHQSRMQRYAELMAEAMYERGQRCGLTRVLVNPQWRFLRGYLLRLGFLDGWRGLLFHLIEANYVRRKYLGLYVRSRRLPL